jgi:hypothetical protein
MTPSSMKFALSPLFLAGLTVLAIGAAGDLTYHILVQGSAMFHTLSQVAAERTLDPVVGHQAYRAHLVTLAGMVITMAGVLQRGFKRGHS